MKKLRNLEERLANNQVTDIFSLLLDASRSQLEKKVQVLKKQHGLKYLADPNSIANNTYPTVSRQKGKESGKITYSDLHSRNPYPQNAKEKLKNSVVGFIGFGGIQGCSEILLRDGVGTLIISDYDNFESTNANRQRFCNESTLGKNKAEAGKEHLQKINSKSKIQIHKKKIEADNIETYFKTCDIIIDGSGDLDIRRAIHSLRKKEGIPTLSWAWAGYEGQYVFMQQEDPLYTKAFAHSPYTNNRGFLCSGMDTINSMIAMDTQKYLTSIGEYPTFPEFTTFNFRRKNFATVRNVNNIVKENEI